MQCRERLIDQLTNECNENIDRNEMIYYATLYNYGKVCKSCTLHIVLLIITCIVIMTISGASFYFYFYLLHPFLYNVISLNKTSLKSCATSS